MGEGWLLTAEMLELIHSGTNNIVCAQPFGCLPNHIVGKGMIRALKDNYPNSNIVAIDYDPSATEINQENRIKLMLANAKGWPRRQKKKRAVRGRSRINRIFAARMDHAGRFSRNDFAPQNETFGLPLAQCPHTSL